MSENPLAIKTENLSKNFGDRCAVNAINIEIKKGEIFSLLGTNGAGKTTTIKMLCGLLKPNAGKALVNGFSISENPMKIKSFIGVSPQETAIAEHLTSKENLLLMGGIYGLSKTASLQRANELMVLLEIEDRKDQARKLSGGLQRRLSIAMALMPNPEILFLDEPTLGLDPHSRKMLWTYIEKLKKEKTILLTTHYLEEADYLADTIAIMHQGKIIEKGTSEHLKKKYTFRQVLKITGSNFSSELNTALKEKGFEVIATNQGIDIEGEQIQFYELVDQLKQHKVNINGIQMKEPSLDDVFIHLTGKEELK